MWQMGGFGSGWVSRYFFSYEFFLIKKLYLLFGKLCSKLLDIKCICITLNLPLISRMNSVKLINTYSIILKLYKSQHCELKQNNTKISKTNTQVLRLHNINIPKYKTKLQMTNWIIG